MEGLTISKGCRERTYIVESEKGRSFEITQQDDNTFSVSEFIPTGAYKTGNGMQPSNHILNLLCDDTSPSKFYRELKRLGYEFDGIQRVSCDDHESSLSAPSLKASRLIIESFLVSDRWLHRRRNLFAEPETNKAPISPLPKPDMNDFNP